MYVFDLLSVVCESEILYIYIKYQHYNNYSNTGFFFIFIIVYSICIQFFNNKHNRWRLVKKMAWFACLNKLSNNNGNYESTNYKYIYKHLFF
jgi:hypothetical protein